MNLNKTTTLICFGSIQADSGIPLPHYDSGVLRGCICAIYTSAQNIHIEITVVAQSVWRSLGTCSTNEEMKGSIENHQQSEEKYMTSALESDKHVQQVEKPENHLLSPFAR